MITSREGIVEGTRFSPIGCPDTSGIEVIAVTGDGCKVRRLHPNYNGEEFFLRWDQLAKSQWELRA